MTTVADVRGWLNTLYPGLDTALTDTQINAALQAPPDYKEHPVARLLRAADLTSNRREGQAGLVLANTERAVNAVLHRGGAHQQRLSSWLIDRLNTATTEKDLTNVAAALGEIRAGGLLLDAGFVAEPVREAKKKTPDFKLHLPSGPVYVEVFTRNMPTDEADALKAFHESPHPPLKAPGSVSFKEHVVHPMGKPKTNETTVENVASKLAGKKPRAEQAIAGHPAILWMDLQDEDVWTLGRKDAAIVRVGNDGDFFTTGLWHAFYGRKGTPMLEAHAVERRQIDQQVHQPFDGTFAQHSTWSAAILALASVVVIFENPNAVHPLRADFFGRVTTLFRFDFLLSWLNWPSGVRPLTDRVDEARSTLAALAAVARYRW